MSKFLIAWSALITWSFASLIFYRSPAGHGPDMVGDEVFCFALPLVIALVVAIATRISCSHDRIPKWTLLLLTIVLAVIEIGVYCIFIVR